ncbi:MAG: bacterial-like globin family protein [Rhodoferax sp.]|nr:bacterial-like globin family protein [Rhodoferax sp.]
MHPYITGLAFALLATLGTSALAQTQTVAPTEGPPRNVEISGTQTSPLYVALGEKAGITALMNDFVDHVREDPRIGAMFRHVKPAYLKGQLTDKICVAAGGPCVYDGETMKGAHADLKIERMHFNALVEVLQGSMRRQNIPFSTQNQLLAVLAPMHRDIVTVR